MSKRSSVFGLPLALRNELEKRLIQRDFAGYEHLSRWLRSRGHAISKSSIHRYGKRLAAKRSTNLFSDEYFARLSRARTIAEESGNKIGVVEALQTMLFAEIAVSIDQLLRALKAQP